MRTRDDRGAINFVKIGIFGGVVVVGYFAWIFVPLWIDHYINVRTAVRTACNIAYANRADLPVRESLKHGIKELALQNEKLNDDGTVTTSPLEFTDDNIDSIDIQKSPPSITVEVHYTRTVVWPLLKKEHSYDYVSTHTEPLDVIKY